MFMNQLYTKRNQKQSTGLRVTLIVKDTDKLLPVNYNEVKNLCSHNGIIFTVREYNAQKFEEDCENIRKLPAFHIYRHNQYQATFYSEDDATVQIKNEYILWQKKQEAIRLKREAWNRRFRTVAAFFGAKR